MKKILLALAAGFTLAVATPVKADIVDDVLRTRYDLIEQHNILFKVVRTKNADGTERMALHLASAPELEWEHRTITRHDGDGWLSGLASKEQSQGGAVYEYSYVPDSARRIIDVSMLFSPNRAISTTPHAASCTPPADGCHTLREKNAIVFTTSFTRSESGVLTSGRSTTLWFTDQGPRVTLGTISFKQLSENATRMVFDSYDQPWAYPLAGYELEKQPDGKKLLRICYSFVDDKCVTNY